MLMVHAATCVQYLKAQALIVLRRGHTALYYVHCVSGHAAESTTGEVQPLGDLDTQLVQCQFVQQQSVIISRISHT
jgi:hypothetical protein